MDPQKSSQEDTKDSEYLKSRASFVEDSDVNTVDWDGPDDPEHPLNWSKLKRVSHVVLVSFMSLTVNFATTMVTPASDIIVRDFHVSNSTVEVLLVSIYLLGFAIGPLVISPLSEVYGRLWIYYVTNVCFLALTLGCAWAPNIGAFMAFRFLAGCAAVAPLTIGGGTIADVIPPEKRGAAMSGFILGPLLGPVTGPIIGGFVAAYLTWQWAFWIIAALSGFNTIVCFLVMSETYAPILLAQRVARLRKETNNPHLRAKESPTMKLSPFQRLVRGVTRPTKMLLFSPIVTVLTVYNSLVFGLVFLLLTTFPSIYQGQYGFTLGTSGLSNLGLGLGLLSGIVLFGTLSDGIVKRQTAKTADGQGQPEMRLPLMVYFSPILPAGFFWYGWCVEYKVHWIVPILGTSLIGAGLLVILMPSQVYLVDAFGADGAASALAALSVLRSLAGCFLPLAGPALYRNLGYGWGNSLLGFIALAFAPVPFIFYRYGAYLRTHFTVQL